jgi:ABC-type transport system involved in cytochrome c biogenesis permease subunit
MRRVLFTIFILLIIIPPLYSQQSGDFSGGYQFLKENIRMSDLEGIPIKGDRVELWKNYADYIVKELRDGGNIKESDIDNNPPLFLFHLAIDDDYRTKAKVLFLKKDDELGIYSDVWIALDDFESDVMGSIQRHLASMEVSAKKSMAEVRANDIAYRADMLKGLQLEGLWLIPPESGITWEAVSSSSDEDLLRAVSDLKEAYKGKDSSAFKTAFNNFHSDLLRYSGRLPSWRILVDKINNLIPSFTISFSLYLLSTLLLFLYMPLKRRFFNLFAVIFIIIGFAFQTLGLALRSIIGWHLPVTNMYEYLSLMGWAIVLLSIIFHLRFKMPVISAIGLPIVVILMVIASLFPANISDQLVPALKSYWLTIHVTLASLGEGAFAIGFVCAILYIVKRNKDKERSEALDELSYRAIAIGYPLFTIGALIAGAIWAERAWGVWWNWDPKETCSLVVWLLATAYLHARLVRGWRGLRSSILAIIIFALSLFTLFANLIFGGLHSYAG